jgi:hypothetical protein
MSRTNGDGGASEHGRSDKGRAKAKARREAKARARWEREAERRVRLCYAVERGGEGHGLSLPEVRCLQTIAVGEKTWTTTAELAQVSLNGTTLAGLVAVGWVEEFVLEDGPAVMLSEWAVEALGLDVIEHWEVFSGVAEQEDSSGERTRMVVREPHEIPRWSTCPLPPEPGMPRPKRVPIKLPFLFRLSKLPEDVIQGLIARTIVDPVEEAIEREECERAIEKEQQFLEQEMRTEDGRLDVDEITSQVKLEPVIIMGQKVPREKPRSRHSKKKQRRRRSA